MILVNEAAWGGGRLKIRLLDAATIRPQSHGEAYVSDTMSLYYEESDVQPELRYFVNQWVPLHFPWNENEIFLFIGAPGDEPDLEGLRIIRPIVQSEQAWVKGALPPKSMHGRVITMGYLMGTTQWPEEI